MFCCKGQLRFSDVIAYHLDPNNPDRLLYAPKSRENVSWLWRDAPASTTRTWCHLPSNSASRIRRWPSGSRNWSWCGGHKAAGVTAYKQGIPGRDCKRSAQA